MNKWLYEESKSSGVDYSQQEQAQCYEKRHREFRDFRKEFDSMLSLLDLPHPETLTLIDMGCGTGAFALHATGIFKTVYAVDVSEAMLAQARAKADPTPCNLVFAQGGFLSYEHKGEPADVVITKMALHHLPNFWKQIALLRINKMLKPDGAFYLHDVVYCFEPSDYAARINAWIDSLAAVSGEQLRRDLETHIRNEYSTFDWIMRGLLECAGFAIEKMQTDDGFFAEYACRKIREANITIDAS